MPELRTLAGLRLANLYLAWQLFAEEEAKRLNRPVEEKKQPKEDL